MEHLTYLGDVARLPYGTKSPEMVRRYSLRAAEFLKARGIKMLVVACNTASAHALSNLRQSQLDVPVLGVIEAGASVAARSSRNKHVLVAATEGTCKSGAFENAIMAQDPSIRVTSIPCQLFVSLAEEGITDGPIAEAVARHYLAPYLDAADGPDCLVLGCTHFPLLKPMLTRLWGERTQMVDCAQAVALEVEALLKQQEMLTPNVDPTYKSEQAVFRLISTDAPERFGRIAKLFFPGMDPMPEVELADI